MLRHSRLVTACLNLMTVMIDIESYTDSWVGKYMTLNVELVSYRVAVCFKWWGHFFGLNKKVTKQSHFVMTFFFWLLCLTTSHWAFYFEQTKIVHLTLDDPLFESAVRLICILSYAVALSQELLFTCVVVSPLCVPAARVSHGGRKSMYIPASKPTSSNTLSPHSSTGQRL